MGKFFCTECGNEIHDENTNYCDKCGAKLVKPSSKNNTICPLCGKPVENTDKCPHCGHSSKKSYKSHILIGYILAAIGLIFPGLALFGAIIGIYLVYKNHEEIFKGKINKTSANALLVLIFSIIGIINLFNFGFIIFEIVAVVILNYVLNTDSEGYYSIHANPKQKLIIVAVILILALICGLWLSGAFSSDSTSSDSPRFVAGGQTTVFGKTFTIPEGFKETNRYGTSNFETVDYENDEGASFEIHVSTDKQFPVSKYVKLQVDKTINGMDGQVLYYQPANTERFVYFDNNGLLVYVSPNTYPSDEIYDIVVC